MDLSNHISALSKSNYQFLKRNYSFGQLHIELKCLLFHTLRNKSDVGYLVNSLLRKCGRIS